MTFSKILGMSILALLLNGCNRNSEGKIETHRQQTNENRPIIATANLINQEYAQKINEDAAITINLSGPAQVTKGGKATYTVSLDLSPLGNMTNRKALWQALHDLQGKGILFGQQHALDQGIHRSDKYGRKSDVHAMTGKYPAVFGFDTDEEPGEALGTAESNGRLFAKAFAEADSLGAIVTLSSHLKNPVSGQDAFDNKHAVPVRRILPDGDLNRKITNWLDTVAIAAQHAVRSDGTKIPIIFRPLHENTGDWFWWGSGHMSDEDFKSLWRYIHAYLVRTKGVDNLLFAYSPNGYLSGNPDKYLAAYPGDEYVDIMGYDAYQSDDSQPDKEWMKDTVKDLTMVNRLAAEHHKVAALTEFGLNEQRVIQRRGNHNIHFFSQLIDAIQTTPEANRFAYMMTWANWGIDEHNQFQIYTPYPGHEMEADFKAFAGRLMLAKTAEHNIIVHITIERFSAENGAAKPVTRQILIQKGNSQTTFSIPTKNEAKAERGERYRVKIDHVQGAKIGRNTVITTIK